MSLSWEFCFALALRQSSGYLSLAQPSSVKDRYTFFFFWWSRVNATCWPKCNFQVGLFFLTRRSKGASHIWERGFGKLSGCPGGWTVPPDCWVCSLAIGTWTLAVEPDCNLALCKQKKGSFICGWLEAPLCFGVPWLFCLQTVLTGYGKPSDTRPSHTFDTQVSSLDMSLIWAFFL